MIANPEVQKTNRIVSVLPAIPSWVKVQKATSITLRLSKTSLSAKVGSWLWRKTSRQNQNRMSHNVNLDRFGAHLLEFIRASSKASSHSRDALKSFEGTVDEFGRLALDLFALQFESNPVYREFCLAQGVSPDTAVDWLKIPAVPAAAFKELELSCLLPTEHTAVFYSSGTSGQQPSRHFHNARSLALYEASLLPWFAQHVLPDLQPPIRDYRLVALTPPPPAVPHSSLVYMFDAVKRQMGFAHSGFFGFLGPDEEWALDLDHLCASLQAASNAGEPILMLGTAFSFVQFLDHLTAQNLRFDLPVHSRLLETGGYKGRSRSLSKASLHSLLSERLGIPHSHIVSEYGMSELSSQAYDTAIGQEVVGSRPSTRLFHFPPWARAQIVSPETGREVAQRETGLIRIFDLANVYSVMAIQTEDLGVRRDEGFELLGRAALAEPRGCSLTSL